MSLKGEKKKANKNNKKDEQIVAQPLGRIFEGSSCAKCCPF